MRVKFKYILSDAHDILLVIKIKICYNLRKVTLILMGGISYEIEY